MSNEPHQPPKLVEFDEETGRIYFPVHKDEAEDFFRSLLGRQQTTGMIRVAPFTVHRDDISQWFHMISQRVSQQNIGVLASTIFRIQFADGFKVTLNSLQEFDAYVPGGDRRCKSITIQLSFILRYRDKPGPERQDVELTIQTFSFSDSGDMPVIVLRSLILEDHALPSGIIELEVRHTARTWSEDIQNLTKQHFEKMKIEEGAIRKLSRKFRNLLAGVASVSVGLGVGALFFQYLQNQYVQFLLAYQSAPSALDKGIEMRLDAMNAFRSEVSMLPLVALMLAFCVIVVFQVAFGATIRRALGRYPESFIVFSDTDSRVMNRAERRAKQSLLVVLLGWTLSVLTSIIANVIYASLVG